MKSLYCIVGKKDKAQVGQLLQSKLPCSVYLGGWDMKLPVKEKAKANVLSNVCIGINHYLKTSDYENIIFCWGVYDENIISELLSRLETDCTVKIINAPEVDEFVRQL